MSIPAGNNDGVPRRSPLELYNAGEPVLIAFGDKLQIIIKKEGDTLRAGYQTLESLNAGEVEEFLKSHGGLVQILRDALDVIGVEQRFEEGSAVLRSVKPDRGTFLSSFGVNKEHSE